MTAKTRNALKDSDFALSGRRDPINDEKHGKLALSIGMRTKGIGEKGKAEIRRKVCAKFPSIKSCAHLKMK